MIQTSNNSVTTPLGVGSFFGPYAIAITPDGNYAYVTNFGNNNFTPIGTTVTAVDLNTNTITATIDLGLQPAGVAITPDSKYAYISNYNSLYSYQGGGAPLVAGEGTVNIIDIATNELLPVTIPVGQSPGAITIDSTGEYAYVSNFSSNTVNVIALQSFQIVAQGSTVQNKYLTQIDLVNKITWTVSGTSLPVSYSIYRDANLTDLAATIPVTAPFVFLDHNRIPDVTYTYYVIGKNQVGTTSVPVVITVTPTA